MLQHVSEGTEKYDCAVGQDYILEHFQEQVGQLRHGAVFDPDGFDAKRVSTTQNAPEALVTDDESEWCLLCL